MERVTTPLNSNHTHHLVYGNFTVMRSIAIGVAIAVGLGLGSRHSLGKVAHAQPVQPLYERQDIAQINVPNYCERFESLFVAVETDNFFVNICGSDLPSHYVGIAKNTGDGIRLPLVDYSPNGFYFEAMNGEFVYILSKTPRGNFLTVTRGTEEILREFTWEDW